MKKNNSRKKILVYSTFLIIAMSFYRYSKKNDITNLDITYVSASYAVDMTNPKEVVGLCSNVFVGYIEEMTETYYISDFPYTRYNVKVISNIKGELPLDTTVRINKEGGIAKDESSYIFLQNDSLPEEGKYYIFNVRKRIEDDSYTASGINTVILIDDVNIQPLTNDISFESSSIYQDYIDAYKNQVIFDPSK